MASRTRGIIKQLPIHLSDLLHRLNENGRLFIELYEGKKERMQAIVSELGEISKEVKEMQKEANTTRMIGAAWGGVGLAVVVAAAFLAAWSSAAERAASMAALGCTAAIVGGAGVITANVMKAVEEIISLESVERLGKEFITIIELLKYILEEIKQVSEELEEKSSSLMTTTRAQAKRGLSKTSQLQQFLNQTAELAEKSREVMNVTLTMQRGAMELFNFITRITPTPEEDAELRNCITGSALQCEKTLHEFADMRNLLKDFEEMQTESEAFNC